MSSYPLWWWPSSIVLYLVLHDGWFYWTHRLLHRPRLFRIAHAVHHASRPPTAWAAMSFHPWESVTGAIVIPLLVFVIPIHVSALLSRSEEHTSELQSLMRISYAVFCLKKHNSSF